MRRLLTAVFLLAAAPLAAQDQQAQSVTLSLPQARAAAKSALAEGDYALSIQLARGLLQADAKDAQAYFILALAHQKLGDLRLSRKAAGYAFRYSEHPRDRFVTAQLAAKTAYRENRPTLSQYWLRRSHDYAPSDKLRLQTEADFKRLRAENPWNVQLSFSVDPSDNVNSGASDPLNDIEETDFEPGTITPSGLALSGVAVNGKLNASYRLSRSKSSETRLRFFAAARQVTLSSEAKALLQSSPFPFEQTLTGKDFSSVYGRLDLSHGVRLGVTPDRPGGNGHGTVGLGYGESWYGGARYFRFVEARAERVFKFDGGHALSASAKLGYRLYERAGADRHSTVKELRLAYGRKLANDGQIAIGLSAGRTDSDYQNFERTQFNTYLSYTHGRKLGPARVSVVLGGSLVEYPRYWLLAGLFTPVTLRREDKSVFGAVTFKFEDYDFAGFSPTLSLRGRKTTSNVGRFDTKEMTLSIGLKSNF